MRIAYLTDSYYPNVNGVVTSMDAFKREHERQGHEVFIFCPRYFGQDEMGHPPHRPMSDRRAGSGTLSAWRAACL